MTAHEDWHFRGHGVGNMGGEEYFPCRYQQLKPSPFLQMKLSLQEPTSLCYSVFIKEDTQSRPCSQLCSIPHEHLFLQPFLCRRVRAKSGPEGYSTLTLSPTGSRGAHLSPGLHMHGCDVLLCCRYFCLYFCF